jgi:hypothetical protein
VSARKAEARFGRSKESIHNVSTTTSNLQRLDRVALGGTILFGMLWWLIFRNHGYDDPYITFRYATNLAAGSGLVYNPGEWVLSTTAPFYALLLALVALVGLPVPAVGLAISAFSHALGGLALYVLGRKWQMVPVGGLAALLYITFFLPISAYGGETTFALALILWGFVAGVAQRWRTTAVLFALAIMTRADAVIALGCLGIFVLSTRLGQQAAPWWVPRTWLNALRELPWPAVGLGIALSAPWFLTAWVIYGAPTPVTLAAKQRQALLPISRGFLESLGDYGAILWGLPTYRLLLILAIIGGGYALLRHQRWLLIIGWSALYTLAYHLIGVTGYFWYFAPVVPGLLVASSLGVQASADLLALISVRLAPAWARRVAIGSAALLAVVLLGGQLNTLNALRSIPDARIALYRDVGVWLNQHTPPDARIGALEIGIIGYYAERPMIDFAGLIQPAVAQQLTPTTGYDTAARWAINQYRPGYLVLHENAMPLAVILPDGVPPCQRIAEFRADRYTETLGIYECQW